MHGRNCVRLLAAASFILAATDLPGQNRVSADRSAVSQSSAPYLPTYSIQYPGPDSVGSAPRFPIIPITPRGSPPSAAPQTFGFPQLARAAGLIFSGTVSGIVRHPATAAQSVETVAISFHVENAIRGTAPGTDVTISQWIGTWSNEQRYRIGERLLLFLYPPSKLGLTSCVGGPLGRFSVDPMRRVMLSSQHRLAFREDPILGGKSRAPLSDFVLAVGQVEGK
jgi:hypothetical protein